MEPFVCEIGVKLAVKLFQQCWKWRQLYACFVFFFSFQPLKLLSPKWTPASLTWQEVLTWLRDAGIKSHKRHVLPVTGSSVVSWRNHSNSHESFQRFMINKWFAASGKRLDNISLLSSGCIFPVGKAAALCFLNFPWTNNLLWVVGASMDFSTHTGWLTDSHDSKPQVVFKKRLVDSVKMYCVFGQGATTLKISLSYCAWQPYCTRSSFSFFILSILCRLWDN